MLSLSDFDYNLPENLIAQNPTTAREGARLFVAPKDSEPVHSTINRLVDHIPSNALIIVNNTKVIAGRIHGHLKSGGKIELFLTKPINENTWTALGRPLKKLKLGTEVFFADQLKATVMQRIIGTDGNQFVQISFDKNYEELLPWLELHGNIPLPPYIKRVEPSVETSNNDRERYQTVYASKQGSVAAPTAGLHFTPQIISQLKDKGVSFENVCLHVGAGTFLPVKSEDISSHHMHSESFSVPSATLKAIKSAQDNNRPIIVVGTTSLRSLESLFKAAKYEWQAAFVLADQWLDTELFIRPTHKDDIYRPFAVNAIMTNFHQPKSTLLMLISALIGYEKTKRLYKIAVENEYRFFSYGDSTLLWF